MIYQDRIIVFEGRFGTKKEYYHFFFELSLGIIHGYYINPE